MQNKKTMSKEIDDDVNDYGLKKNKIIEKFTPLNLGFDDFDKWMRGQTVMVDFNDDQVIYYHEDIDRYINMKVNNKPTYFD